MGQRGDRFRLRAVKQKEAKAINGPRKTAERIRRDKRMVATLKTAKAPYTKVVRTWLSSKLGKAESAITDQDVKGLIAKLSA